MKVFNMSKLRSVSTGFWSDPWIEELTTSEKLLYLYLITNEKTNMLGVYEVSFRKISFETGIDKKTIEKAFESFERVGKVRYVKNYVVLLNFLKHQNFNTNMKKSAIDIYNNLPNELKNSDLILDRDKPLESFETLSKCLGMVRKVEIEYEDEIEDEKEEENTFSFRSALLSLGVDSILADEWLKVRKAKKAVNTETAFNALKREVEKSGLVANICIKIAVEKSWSGFNAEWINNTISQKKQVGHEASRMDFSDNTL